MSFFVWVLTRSLTMYVGFFFGRGWGGVDWEGGTPQRFWADIEKQCRNSTPQCLLTTTRIKKKKQQKEDSIELCLQRRKGNNDQWGNSSFYHSSVSNRNSQSDDANNVDTSKGRAPNVPRYHVLKWLPRKNQGTGCQITQKCLQSSLPGGKDTQKTTARQKKKKKKKTPTSHTPKPFYLETSLECFLYCRSACVTQGVIFALCNRSFAWTIFSVHHTGSRGFCMILKY